jgi:hypothetical protein
VNRLEPELRGDRLGDPIFIDDTALGQDPSKPAAVRPLLTKGKVELLASDETHLDEQVA